MLLHDFTSGAENILCGENRASCNSAFCNEKKKDLYRATTDMMNMINTFKREGEDIEAGR